MLSRNARFKCIFWGYVSHVKNTFPQLIDDDTAISRSYCQQELHFFLSILTLSGNTKPKRYRVPTHSSAFPIFFRGTSYVLNNNSAQKMKKIVNKKAKLISIDQTNSKWYIVNMIFIIYIVFFAIFYLYPDINFVTSGVCVITP